MEESLIFFDFHVALENSFAIIHIVKIMILYLPILQIITISLFNINHMYYIMCFLAYIKDKTFN